MSQARVNALYLEEPIQEQLIYDQWLGLTKRLSMSRIMASRKNAATVDA